MQFVAVLRAAVCHELIVALQSNPKSLWWPFQGFSYVLPVRQWPWMSLCRRLGLIYGADNNGLP
jgi:integral membrane sensor domain MASE1